MQPPRSNDEAIAILMDAEEATDEDDLARALPMYEGLVAYLRASPPPRELRDDGFNVTIAMLLQNLATMAHHLDDYERMLGYTTELLVETADDAGAYEAHAVALQHLGRLDEALAASTKSIELDPMLANGHYEHACVLTCLGRLDDALEHLERALDLGADRDDLVDDEDLVPLHARERWDELVSDERQARVMLERFRAATKALDATAPAAPDQLVDWLTSDGTIEQLAVTIALADEVLAVHDVDDAPTYVAEGGRSVIDGRLCTPAQRVALNAMLEAGHVWKAIPFLNVLGDRNIPNLTAEEARILMRLADTQKN